MNVRELISPIVHYTYLGLHITLHHRAAGLMGGQHKHLGNLHMGRSAYGVEAHIGDVVARQGLNAVVNMTGALFVTMESDVGEIGFHQARLHIGNANATVGHINTQAIANGFTAALVAQYTFPPA